MIVATIYIPDISIYLLSIQVVNNERQIEYDLPCEQRSQYVSNDVTIF